MKNKFKFDLQRHAVENPDLIAKTKEEFREEIKQALESGDTEKFSQAFTDYMANIEQAVMREAQGVITVEDSNILQTRGVRQLTSKEKDFYQKTIKAMQAAPNSVNNLDVVMPETVVNSVFDDLTVEHELLSVIDFKNATGLTRILINTNAKQLAQWGPLNSEIVKELESGFKEISLGQNKLSAFMLVSQDMLDLGPVWLDRYVREVMYEALAFGLENAIIQGTGKNMPIGMIRDLNGAVVDGEYPEKDAIKVTELDPVTYGQLLANLSKTEKDNPRVVNNVIMVVNPTDYLTKIMPATTIRKPDGTYANNVLPYPTRIIQSMEMPEGKAVIGMADKYWMGMGLIKDGKIEYSDEYKFLEDYRTYKIRFLGHGQAKDNNAFIVADISELKPLINKVEVVQETPEVPEA